MMLGKERWVFLQTESKPVLSASDVRYWKSTLRRISKIGMEFEFNLPENKGHCKGENDQCPCSNIANHDCWHQCLHYERCAEVKHISRCAQAVAACKNKTCIECASYEFACPQVFCTSFYSACVDCGGFTRDCDSCEYRYDPKTNPEAIRRSVTRELNPSHSYGSINASGVHSVVPDGSLLGDSGMEVITVGRRVDFTEYYNMTKKIIDAALLKGAYVNERCSVHMHLLASYYGNLAENGDYGIPNAVRELERDMPQIILANFHQLCRRYQNAITWMTMGLNEKKRLTRWEKFRVSIMDISPVVHSMDTVRELAREYAGGKKYSWVNYCYMRFAESGDVKQMHLELRTCDGLLSPSAVSAIACMLYALMIKAVEISRYGILEIGGKGELKRAFKIKDALLNNCKGYQDGDRFGNTSRLEQYYDTLTLESLELLRQLKHILLEVGPAYSILEQLAEKPVALRRVEGQSWQDIEKSLEVPVEEETAFDGVISQYIDLRLVESCKSLDEWISAVGKALGNEPIDLPEDIEGSVRKYINNKSSNGEVLWSDTLGAIVSVS